MVDKRKEQLMSTLQSLEKRRDDLGIEIERVRSRRLESQAELWRLSALAEKGDNNGEVRAGAGEQAR